MGHGGVGYRIPSRPEPHDLDSRHPATWRRWGSPSATSLTDDHPREGRASRPLRLRAGAESRHPHSGSSPTPRVRTSIKTSGDPPDCPAAQPRASVTAPTEQSSLRRPPEFRGSPELRDAAELRDPAESRRRRRTPGDTAVTGKHSRVRGLQACSGVAPELRGTRPNSGDAAELRRHSRVPGTRSGSGDTPGLGGPQPGGLPTDPPGTWLAGSDLVARFSAWRSRSLTGAGGTGPSS